MCSVFSCEACGSSAIVAPMQLDDTADVRCGGCGRSILTWAELKVRARSAILADAEARNSAVLSVDPLYVTPHQFDRLAGRRALSQTQV
jgi:predicted Fe-S protein YdhL (DUF1289 family)